MTFSITASLLVPALLMSAVSGQAAAAAKAKSSTAAHNTTSKKTTSTKKAAAPSKAKSHAHKGHTAARRKPAGPSYQTRPTADRYKEIQQSLADKGYFKGEVNGTWGDDSVEALKRFQSDHKITDDGKLNSLSLIQLGLGPNHDSAALHPAGQPEASPALPTVTEAPADTTAPLQ